MAADHDRQAADADRSGEPIAGGGFDELHVFDSFVEGPPWIVAPNQIFAGADGIHVDVPFVWVERCTVYGAPTVADLNDSYTSCPDAGDAIETTGPAHLGQPWMVGWDVPFNFALLFVAFDVGPAPQLGNPNLYLPPPHFLGLVLPPTGEIHTVVPADVALTGVEYAVQVYSLVGWSRPLAGVIAP